MSYQPEQEQTGYQSNQETGNQYNQIPPYQQYQQTGYQEPTGHQEPTGYQTGYQSNQIPPYQQNAQTPPKQPNNSGSFGLSTNMASGLSYAFGIFSGLAFFLTEKQNRIVRFHALQSILFFTSFWILNIIVSHLPFGLSGAAYLLDVVTLVGWIVLMLAGFQGKYIKLPIIGDCAEKYTR